MDKARVYVDFNERVDSDVYLLSKEDTKINSEGNIVTFYEGMPVSIYTDDASSTVEIDNIIAEGVAIKNDSRKYGFPYVKWCCRVDLDSIMNESDLKFLQLLPKEIKNNSNDLYALRELLIKFKNSGMDKTACYKICKN